VLDQVAAYGRPVRFSEMLAASPFPNRRCIVSCKR